MIVCGDAGPGLADSMYAGTVFLGGKHGELGADAVIEEVAQDERELIAAQTRRYQVAAACGCFRQGVSARRLVGISPEASESSGSRLFRPIARTW